MVGKFVCTGVGPTLYCVLSNVQTVQPRPRSERKPVTEENKDDKYFDRRKRNNLSAKKSRDQRKKREDRNALRATSLENENAVLRAQVSVLRDHANTLRNLIIQKQQQRK